MDAAEQVFEQAAERYPIDPSALKQLSTVAEQLGHITVARSTLIEYVSLRPASRDAAADAARIGTLSLALHDAAGALPWLQRALAEKPQDIVVLGAMADAQLQTGDAGAARLTLNRAIAIDPSNTQVLAVDRRLKRAGA
jgi:Flp pilus assembly protein TadD